MALAGCTLGKVKRIERIRLYPSARQERALQFILDVTRELYNALLQERGSTSVLRKISQGLNVPFALAFDGSGTDVASQNAYVTVLRSRQRIRASDDLQATDLPFALA